MEEASQVWHTRFFLQQRVPEAKVIVLERTEAFATDRQGFSLTLQGEAIKLLHRAKLLDEILRHGRRSTRKLFIEGTTGRVLFDGGHKHSKNAKFNSYPLPRQALRKVFLDALKPNTVRFGEQVVSVEEQRDGLSVQTASGKTLHADFLVACDGINSAIRKKFLPELQLRPFGLANVYLIADLDSASEAAKEMLRGTTLQVLDGKHRLFAKPFNAHAQMFEMTWPEEHLEDGPIAYSEKQEKWLKRCQDIAASWNVPEIQEMLARARVADVIVHPLFDIDPETVVPAIVRSQLKRILFLGDTIHPMAPYVGMGANSAIIDAANAAEFIASGAVDMCAFMTNLMNRAGRCVRVSRDNVNFYHSCNGVDEQKLKEFKKWK